MVIDHLRCIRIIWILIFLSLNVNSLSQNITGCDLKFITHLVNTGQFQEALFLLDSSNCSSFLRNDTINFLRGWSLYSLNQPLFSSESFLKITPSSSLYLKSHFYAVFNYAQLTDFTKAEEVLNKIELNTDSLAFLRNYELAGIKLLQGNLPLFEECMNKVDKSYPAIIDSYDRLLNLSSEMKNHRSKSPFIAGLMSGIVPGSGKLYAGRKGEALTAFLSTVGLGLVTWENYKKNGINNFQTIAFGSVFVVTYIANIYGAVFSVRIIETEYIENVKSTILFNLHIPLVRIFGK